MPEPPCKPSSVPRLRAAVANIPLVRALPRASSELDPEARPGRSNRPRLAAGATPPYSLLHRVGFALPRRSPGVRCALTAPFHPCHARHVAPFGGLFSVALSCGLPRPVVNRHPALWCSDFPRRLQPCKPTRSPERLRPRQHNMGCAAWLESLTSAKGTRQRQSGEARASEPGASERAPGPHS